MSDHSYEDVKRAVFNAAQGRDPGTYTSLGGRLKLTISATDRGLYEVDYWNGYQGWKFEFSYAELLTGRLMYA